MLYLTTLVLLLLVGWGTIWMSQTKWGEALERKSICRDYRRHRKQRPKSLSHLTDEQWQSHIEAFVDYQCSTGKYCDFKGLIPEWLEGEGLPPSPHLRPASGQELHKQFWAGVAEEHPHLAELAKREIEQGL